MKKFFNKILKTVLPIFLGLLILFMIYDDFDFSRLWSDFVNMNIFWFLLSTFFGVMSHVVRGWRWKLTLAPLGYNPSTVNSVYSIFIAYAANLVIPRVGEVSRCVVLEQNDNVPFAQSLGTVVSERLIDTLMVLLITLFAVALQWPVFVNFIDNVGLAVPGAGGFSVSGWLVILLSFVAIVALLFIFLKKMAFWKKIRSFIAKFVEGLLSLTRMKRVWLFVLETIAIWFCYFMQFYLCFFCFEFTSTLSVSAGLLLFVAGSIAVVVPTPNGAGPWHFAIISIMMLYGVSLADAEAFALIVHSTQTLLVAVLGVYALFMLQMKKYLNNK
ncbi:MAG: flippase-like domain-containing protein [Bacteroidaceae bacterium]|nr:flippase-like domain-containing protein [Bacteroidaceae bacterium]